MVQGLEDAAITKDIMEEYATSGNLKTRPQQNLQQARQAGPLPTPSVLDFPEWKSEPLY